MQAIDLIESFTNNGFFWILPKNLVHHFKFPPNVYQLFFACNYLGLKMWNYKTVLYFRIKGVLDSIELRMLRRVDYVRELEKIALSKLRNAVSNSVG